MLGEMLSEAFPAALSPPLLFLAGLIGSLIGSFLNVCIYRLPRGLSVVLPPSACPHCGGPIPWYLNVPIFSWLMLRGRAACCGEPIPARYLLVEAATAVSAVAIMARDGATLEGFARFAFLAALIVLFFTDLDLRLLPDAVTLTGAAAGLLLSFARPWLGAPLAWPLGWSSAFLAAALGSGGFYLVALIWHRLRNVQAVGGGDIKMMALIGAFLGIPGMLVTLLVGSVFGSLVGFGIAARYAGRRLEAVADRRPGISRAALAGALFFRGMRRRSVPFGCFLSVGGIFACFLGEPLARWYLGLLR